MHDGAVLWWEMDADQLDFLLGDYRPELFWFEMVEFVKKFLLTGALVFAEQGSLTQMALGMFIGFFSFALVAAYQPYAVDLANKFKLINEANLFLTMLCLMCLRFDALLLNELFSSSTYDLIMLGGSITSGVLPFMVVSVMFGGLWCKKHRKKDDAHELEDLVIERWASPPPSSQALEWCFCV